MRPRAVGGLEPDDADQRELVELWHISRTALATGKFIDGRQRIARLEWVIAEFLKAHPEVARKWVYVWCSEFLGLIAYPEPVDGGRIQWPDGPTTAAHAKPVPKPKRSRKKRAK
jgi:hypothetical protein